MKSVLDFIFLWFCPSLILCHEARIFKWLIYSD